MSFIVIQHYQFPIRDPFKEGHVLTEIEADVLNWHRATLIQKVTQRWVLEAINGNPSDILSLEILDTLSERIKEYDKTYELSARKAPKASLLEYNLEKVAYGVLLNSGEMEPTEEDIARVKRTPAVQARARDLIRSSTFSEADLLS